MISLGRVKLLPAREQVASVLRKAILSREIEEGQEITLEGIATQVGVSSMPVREAFQILANDGLIKLRPNKGAVVLGVNEKTIRDHYETRAVLEGATAALASKATDISTIEHAYDVARQALDDGDSKLYSEYNQSFHMEIWTAAGNDKMRTLLSTMWNGLSMGHQDTEESYAQVSIAEHEKILAAMKAGDEKLAKKRMEDHIIRSMNNILTRFGSQ